MVHLAMEKSLNTRPVKVSVNDVNTKGIPSKKMFLVGKLVEFCKRTDLHGYRYIVMEDFNVVERSCWAFAVIISIVIAACFVVMAYKWYARNPIVTVIESTQGAIWDVPFPAVTICDLNIVSRKAAKSFSQQLNLPKNVTQEFIYKTLKFIPLLFSTFPPEPEQKAALYQLQTILDLNNKSIDALFAQLSPASQCNNLVQRCMWKSTVYPCDELFKPIFTLLGQCCAFNYYAVDDSEKEPNNKASYLPSPRRVASCGYQTALTVLVYTDPDDYYSATIASQGALVMIDSAYNVPDLDSPVRMVNPSTEVLIALSPERTYATEGIKDFEPKQRHCYYNNEWLLGGFRQYSFHNCMAYEKVNFLMRMCQCVPLFFPMKGIYRKCNFKDLNCIDNALRYFQTSLHPECKSPVKMPTVCAIHLQFSSLGSWHPECDVICHLDIVIQYGINPNELLETKTNLVVVVLGNEEYQKRNSSQKVNDSNCLPECEHYDYPLEVALGKLADQKYVHNLPLFDDVNLKNHSLLNVFFNDLVSTRYRRDVYLNWQNILAAFGGLLSLMLGFTLIAGFDLVLFFTIRVAYNFFKPTSDGIGHNKIYVQEHKTNSWTGRSVPRAQKPKHLQYGNELYYGYGRY